MDLSSLETFIVYPWDHDELDLDFKNYFKDKSDLSIIDLGCGNGSQTYHLEEMGFNVTSTDIDDYLRYEVDNFIIDDALDSQLDKQYDVILDRGLIHNLIVDERYPNYFDLIDKISHNHTTILLKVMSPYENRFIECAKPYRFSEDQLVELYSQSGFSCTSIEDSYYYSHIEPYLRGYYCVYGRNRSSV